MSCCKPVEVSSVAAELSSAAVIVLPFAAATATAAAAAAATGWLLMHSLHH
jgi:hypothetical protein